MATAKGGHLQVKVNSNYSSVAYFPNQSPSILATIEAKPIPIPPTAPNGRLLCMAAKIELINSLKIIEI